MRYRELRGSFLAGAFVVCLLLWTSGCGNPLETVDHLMAKLRAALSKPAPNTLHDKTDTGVDGAERYVAFESSATNLVPGDTNQVTDIFVYDRQTKETTRVSVSSRKAQANGASFSPVLTSDGRYVVFESLATNLVPDDTNKQRDVFVHDRQTGETSRVSVGQAGIQANNFSQSADLSEDGRFVAFESLASNLVPNDTNGVIDIFVRDRLTNQSTRVSVSSGGQQANNTSVRPMVSADGRYVTFESFATNLSTDMTDGPKRTFVHDRQTGRTREGTNAAAHGTNAPSTASPLRADGR